MSEKCTVAIELKRMTMMKLEIDAMSIPPLVHPQVASAPFAWASCSGGSLVGFGGWQRRPQARETTTAPIRVGMPHGRIGGRCGGDPLAWGLRLPGKCAARNGRADVGVAHSCVVPALAATAAGKGGISVDSEAGASPDAVTQRLDAVARRWTTLAAQGGKCRGVACCAADGARLCRSGVAPLGAGARAVGGGMAVAGVA